MLHSSEHFQLLYNQYKVLVYNVTLHYVRNVEDVEEITQDVFVQVHHSIDTFNDKSTEKTWM